MSENLPVMYVYIISNLISGRQYVGSRKCYGNICDDNYMSSSKYLKLDIKKYGLRNFQKEILEEGFIKIEELLKKETFYILKYNTLYPNGYNKFLPDKKLGFHMFNHKHSTKSKNKISKSLMGSNNPNFGKHISDETREKMRLAKLGKPSGVKGKKWKTTSKEKLSKTRIEKELAKGEKNPMYGKKSWNSGLTKDTDERLKKIGDKIKIVKSRINK